MRNMKNIEVIERKGIGHPDTIADDLSERLSEELFREYKKVYGSPKHYNVDKTMVCAGEIQNNKFTNPVKIVFAGQYTKLKNIDDILEKTVKDILSFEIKKGMKYEVYNFLNQGSPDLNDIFACQKANDTSFAVGLPESKNEKLVKEIGNYIDNLHKTDKHIGRDNKVMFVFDGKEKHIYIALAFINNFKSKEEYFKYKKQLEEKLKAKFKIKNIQINIGDTKELQFLTKTGTSLEMGDSGATGRGNRRNGLITPTRPMTLEAYYGKNKITHIGRTYQDLAITMARKKKKNILLLNKIGGDIKKPIVFEI
ncbi:MAG TPA: methionine adenosyltransferase [Candidatus Diapherotrites archaeon]|nr:methionine adenosyltransferase [Candidatus Diapherotrites archaeon]